MNSTINFLYFLSNHKGMDAALVDCFGEHKGKHFASKLSDGTPAGIIKLMMEMTDDNKTLFLGWVENNYNYNGL